MRSDNRPQWIWFCGWLLLMCGVRLQSMDRGGVGGGSLGWGMVQAASREELLSTREEILVSRERRAKQIEALLMDSKQRYNDHTSGVRLLSDGELTDLQKKMEIYQRKLDSLQAPLEEREVERIIRREQLRNERLNERRRMLHSEL